MTAPPNKAPTERLPICERLLRLERSAPYKGLVHEWHCNPDGPEAAAIIEGLVAALDHILHRIPIIDGKVNGEDAEPFRRAAQALKAARATP